MTVALEKKLVAVTGCDTGIGKSLTGILLQKGYTVVAGYLQKKPFPRQKRLFTKKMDLRKENDIKNFAIFVQDLVRQGYILEALINNAGMVAAAPVENLPISAVREVFEVNYFGTFSLTQKLLPLILKNRGKILIVGSMAGKIGLPFFSPYVSSKFALEGLTESLRREMNAFRVRTVMIEPGAVATPIWNTSWKRIQKELLPHVGDRYRAAFVSGARKFVSGGNRGLESDKAASKILRIMESKRPAARYVIAKNVLTQYLEMLIPTGLMDKLTSLLFGLKKIKK